VLNITIQSHSQEAEPFIQWCFIFFIPLAVPELGASKKTHGENLIPIFDARTTD
jgi:hypothetical protein